MPRNSDWTSAHDAALNWFFDTFSGDTAQDLAKKFTCPEIDALAQLMRVCEREGLAAEWINSHSHTDEEGDKHYRTPDVALRLELEEIAGTVPGVELREEDPEEFGAGHLVLSREDTEILAFTEYNDRPGDDTNVSGWDWRQVHHSPSGGPVHIDATGRHSADDVEQLTAVAWAWATH